MPKPLVIVESPAKARTIAGFLGGDFVVESSIGHIRDLPGKGAEIPEAYKKEAWARLGVDVDNDFKPLYVVPAQKRDQVRKLKALLKDADEVYLATDEDREGEAIAWHLLEVLNPRVPVKRMVFHEITPQAIQHAVDNWRDLNLPLVDAQETRRILDRLYGYEVSPVLWRKVGPGLSAGRVQSVATRMVVERERARMRFTAASYWDIEGRFTPKDTAADAGFPATLISLNGSRLATGKDFDEKGQLTKQGAVVLDEPGAQGLAARLSDAEFAVRSVEEKPYRKSPAAPFMTSTLQQEASRKLGFGSQRTMAIAQRLYENGYITYMRTDSTSLSETAINAARTQAAQLYGPDYVPDKPRFYNRKVKNAQEAHEAIRPAGDFFRLPDDVASELGGDEIRLYDLIWKRTVASQMVDAVGRTVTVRLGATSSSGEDAEFSTSGTVITFPGYQRAYVEGSDDPEGALEARDRHLPPLSQGDALDALSLDPKGHTTSPPARYTEASLIKALEEMGVGRPSTYASIMGTIQDRGYVWKKGSALVPSYTAFAVVNLLERHFDKLVDYAFTASMEDDLDQIANKEEERVPWLQRFYFGNASSTASDQAGLKSMVSERLDQIDARAVNTIPVGTDTDGVDIVVRCGRYGPYLQKGEDDAKQTAPIPEDLAPDELTVEKAVELLNRPRGDRVLGDDPATGLPVIAKPGRFGPYVQLGENPESTSKVKPHTASLFKDMELDSITLEDALRLLQLPRTVGVDPADGQEIVALNGKYGPYIKKGTDSRSLTEEEQLFTVTLDEALTIFAQPRMRGGRVAAPPLKELGEDPVSNKPVVVKEGRFGPYVTDGETNASLRKGDTVEGITIERAAELLADRRAAGPSKKAGRKAAGATKKTAAKKATGTKKATGVKKAAKKATGVKKAAKKAAPPQPTAD